MYTYRVHHLEPDDIKEISHGLSTMVIALKRKKGYMRFTSSRTTFSSSVILTV